MLFFGKEICLKRVTMLLSLMKEAAMDYSGCCEAFSRITDCLRAKALLVTPSFLR